MTLRSRKLLRLSHLLCGVLFCYSLQSTTLLAMGQTTERAKRAETVIVSGEPQGISTRYIGATEGSIKFDIEDLQDLGINTYRIYGGMSRWEANDDDGVYGLPSIAEIKADPQRINWQWWDQVMTHPAFNSDYSWSGPLNAVWQGNARTIFEALKRANIRPVVTLRNTDERWQPAWALQLNPPRTEAGWNEWWAHVFATVYWLNVRNDYQVDDFEIHNEPDNRPQGWGGTQADYLQLVRVSRDAIDHVYKTYLPGRRYNLHAPATVGGSDWPLYLLNTEPDLFDSVNIHNYDMDISPYTRQVRQWMAEAGLESRPLWMGEWGTYDSQNYNSVPFALNLIKNLIRGSQQDSYIDGSHLFALYDWGQNSNYQGLISQHRRVSYYAMRLAIRALQGGRSVYPVQVSNPDLMAIVTRDEEEDIHLLMVNSTQRSHSIHADLSQLLETSRGTLRQFNAEKQDEVVGHLVVQIGQVTFGIPEETAIAIEFSAEN